MHKFFKCSTRLRDCWQRKKQREREREHFAHNFVLRWLPSPFWIHWMDYYRELSEMLAHNFNCDADIFWQQSIWWSTKKRIRLIDSHEYWTCVSGNACCCRNCAVINENHKTFNWINTIASREQYFFSVHPLQLNQVQRGEKRELDFRLEMSKQMYQNAVLIVLMACH